MIAHLIVTVIADDRPGVVETLADTIAAHRGNWLESQLTHMHGKFAGIVAVATQESDVYALQTAIAGLSKQGFVVTSERAQAQPSRATLQPFTLTIVGPDRPGIIREVSRALAKRGINLVELSSECSSMPWSGEPMFTARGQAHMPQDTNLAELGDALDLIAEELGLDIAFEDRQEA